MGAESSKGKYFENELLGQLKESARYFIMDNEVYWSGTGERITEIRVSERGSGKKHVIYEFSKEHKPGRLNVRVDKHRIVETIRMG